MPDLDAVTQTFYANVAPYVEMLKQAAAAAKDLAGAATLAAEAIDLTRDAANAAATAAAAQRVMWDGLNGAMADTAMVAIVLAGAENLLRDAMFGKNAMAATQLGMLDELRGAMAMAALLAGMFTQAEENMTRQMLGASAAAALQSRSMLALAASATAAAAATATAAAAASGAGSGGGGGGGGGGGVGGFGIFGWFIYWNQLHWLIAGTSELLAVTVPAAIAAASAAFVMYQGVVEDLGERLQSTYTATESTAAIFGKTTGDVLGLGHAFQTAQNEANPVAYELMGSYINIANKHMVDLAGSGLQVAQALGELSAKMDIALGSGRFDSLIANMTQDLIELGQVFGNVGHAIANFATDMPGLAEVLLSVVDGLSKLLLIISSLPGPVITAFMAFEEFNRWGGFVFTSVIGRMGLSLVDVTGKWYTFGHAAALIQNIMGIIPMLFVRLGDALAVVGGKLPLIGAAVTTAGEGMAGLGVDAGLAVAGLSTLATIGIAGAVLALGTLIFFLARSKDATQQLGAQLQKGIDSSTNVQALNSITNALSQMNVAYQQTPQYIEAGGVANARMGQAVKEVNPQLAQNVAIQQTMVGEFGKVVSGGLDVAKIAGTNMAGGFALADLAGVKLNKTVNSQGQLSAVAKQQIENLTLGYKAMDQSGGTLQNDLDAVNIQLGLQNTKVQQLNSAWDQFMQNATGMTSTFASMNTDISEIGNVTIPQGTTAFNQFSGTVTLTAQQASQAMSSFSGVGAEVWQNYDASLQQAEQYTDSLRTSAAYGAVSQKNFAGQVAYAAEQLLPYAQYNKTATEQLSALVQEAGGPATSNYTTLKNWIDKTALSTQQFTQATQQETGQLSDAEAAASEFSSTLQQQVADALAKGVTGADNLTQQATQLAQAVHQGASGMVVDIGTKMLQSFEQMGMSAQTAQGLVVAALTASGMSVTAADNLVKQMQTDVTNLANTLPKLNQTVHINIVASISGNASNLVSSTGTSAGGVHIMGRHGLVMGFAGGGMVGGVSGLDANLAALTAGEAVLTARAVSAVGGPLGVHALNNQPSEAVLTTGGGGAGAGSGVINLTLRVPVMLNGQTLATANHSGQLTYDRRNANANVHLNRPGRPG